MQKIEGSPKSLKQLLQNTKYTIHYYQREYMWQRKNIEELVDDLTSEFLDFYQAGDPRTAVANYGVYFMGSVVLAGRENGLSPPKRSFCGASLEYAVMHGDEAERIHEERTGGCVGFAEGCGGRGAPALPARG